MPSARCMVVVAALAVVTASCDHTTAPASPYGAAVTVTATIYPTVWYSADSSASAFTITVHSTFVNVQDKEVYVHSYCDGTIGGSSFIPNVILGRPVGDTTRVAYESGVCALSNSGDGLIAVGVLPGDSIVSAESFTAMFQHTLTALDSERLTGPMVVVYDVAYTPDRNPTADQIIPAPLRTSQIFQVALP